MSHSQPFANLGVTNGMVIVKYQTNAGKLICCLGIFSWNSNLSEELRHFTFLFLFIYLFIFFIT